MLNISIPTPCHEDWDKMTPDATGRHCSACAKSVVDFTNMSDEEVKHFFLNKKEEERVCGRFKQNQLHNIVIELPQNTFSIQMPLWKKFLAACLVVFSTTLFSCETQIKGKEGDKIETVEIVGALKISDVNQTDNTNLINITPTQGEFIKPEACSTTVGELQSIPLIIKGDIDITEVDTVKAVTDTVGNEILKPIRDTVYEQLVGQVMIKNDPITPVKTKDPQKADPENCKTIKNYY